MQNRYRYAILYCSRSIVTHRVDYLGHIYGYFVDKNSHNSSHFSETFSALKEADHVRLDELTDTPKSNLFLAR